MFLDPSLRKMEFINLFTPEGNLLILGNGLWYCMACLLGMPRRSDDHNT